MAWKSLATCEVDLQLLSALYGEYETPELKSGPPDPPGAGPTGAGSTGAGFVGAGFVGAGSAEVGSAGVDSAGVDFAGVDSAGAGSAGGSCDGLGAGSWYTGGGTGAGEG